MKCTECGSVNWETKNAARAPGWYLMCGGCGHEYWPGQTEQNPDEQFRLPVVAGRRSAMSNADFERACLVHIERLQCGIGPYDSAMMSTFCESVRMVREYSDAMQSKKMANPSDRAKGGES